MPPILYYVHDPMCSWCWAFRPTWQKIRAALPADLTVQYVLGGLAPDTEEPMPLALQRKIRGIWETIQQQVPGTEFNFDFWTQCQPRRATYPACRAVIAATKQGSAFEEAMILAIQRAYYLRACNPSEEYTLLVLAEELGLDKARFREDLQALETHQALLKQIEFSRTIGGYGFPSLILEQSGIYSPIGFDYTDPSIAVEQIMALLDEA
jgi:putative protein-disulfide isomerase